MRLDDSEHPRLEIKWNQQEADIDRALKKYLRSLERVKRGADKPEIEQDERFLSRRSTPSKRTKGFHWKTRDLRGAGLIWYCQECGRTVFGQVTCYHGEDAVSLAKELFGAMEDHAKDGRHLWAVYGLECWLPEEYHLLSQRLMAGFIELVLQGKRTRKYRLARWGLAEEMLKDQSLEDWYFAKGVQRKSELRWAAHDTIVKGHAGLKLYGQSRRPAMRFYNLAKVWLRAALKKPPLETEEMADGLGYLWHCPESNRIYIVECINDNDKERLEEVVESVPCH